jgi:hypothetical protein
MNDKIKEINKCRKALVDAYHDIPELSDRIDDLIDSFHSLEIHLRSLESWIAGIENSLKNNINEGQLK